MFALQPLANFGTAQLLLLLLIFGLICVLLILVILMQKGKGEGLAGLVGGVSASDNMGTPEAQKELSTYTRNFALIFFLLCIVLSVVSTRCGGPEDLLLPGETMVAPDQSADQVAVEDLEDAPAVTPEDVVTDALATGEVEFVLATEEAAAAIEEATEATESVVDEAEEASPEAL